jgi:hypothetical protein
MAVLATYDDLVKDIIDQSHRKDIQTRVPRFIALAESEMFSNPDEILEIRESEKTAILTTVADSRFLDLPLDFIQQRDFKITISSDEVELHYVTPSSLRITNTNSAPRYFTVTDKIEFDRVPDQLYTVTMKYFSDFTPLSDTNQANEVLLNEPNVYFFGALKQVFAWSEDDDQLLKYEALFKDAIKGANKKNKAGRYGKTPVMTFKGATA